MDSHPKPCPFSRAGMLRLEEVFMAYVLALITVVCESDPIIERQHPSGPERSHARRESSLTCIAEGVSSSASVVSNASTED